MKSLLTPIIKKYIVPKYFICLHLFGYNFICLSIYYTLLGILYLPRFHRFQFSIKREASCAKENNVQILHFQKQSDCYIFFGQQINNRK